MPDDDDLFVTLVATFWHPHLGLVLWHTNELDEAFVLRYPSLPEERAQDASDGYIDLLGAETIGDMDVTLN